MPETRATSTRDRLEAILRERIAVLDGSWGVLIQREVRGEEAYRSVSFDDVREAYAQQIRALREGGVDLLLIETIFDSLNAKAAIVAALDEAPELPLWLSFTAIDRSGRNLSGQTVEAWWVSVEHASPLLVGVNCSLGAREMRPFVEDLARVATTYTSCHPNAGLPNEFGGYDEQAHDTSG